MAELAVERLSTEELFQYFVLVLDELKRREITRTSNNPIADYAEWLVAHKLNLKLANNSQAGFDALGNDGVRYQVKCRRLGSKTGARQLSVIRKLEANEFDYLIGVLFHRDFKVAEAYKIPHAIISKYARFRQHVNGHILHLQGLILTDPGIEDITSSLTGGI